MNASRPTARGIPRPALRVSMWPHVLLGVTLGLVVVAAIATGSWIESREEAAAAREVARAEARIVRRMSVYVAQLRAAGALFDAAGEVIDRERFRRFAAGLQLNEYPGIQGVGWVERLETPAEATRVVSSAKADGFTDYRIFPSSHADERYAIVYIEPIDARNRAALGIDMYAEPVRREAMERARDTGAPAMSGRVQLMQEIRGPVQHGFVIYVPVYRGGTVPPTVEARREQLLGFAYAPFRADDLFDAILGEDRPADVEVFDGESLDERHRLYGRSPPDDARSEVVVREIAGHPWTLRITAHEHGGITTSFGAALMVGLLGTLFALAAHRAGRRESEARLRAEEALAREERDAEIREVFLGVLGHDLRNPLQAILMTARMLLATERADGDASRRALERIVSSTQRASRMVSQLLDMTRARVGEGLVVRREPVDVGALARDTVSELRAAHPDREIELEVVTGDEPLAIEGDPDRLAQVLGNLGANAIVHGDAAHPVQVRAHRRADEGEILVEVSNVAPPIPSDVVASLFDPFARAHTSPLSPGDRRREGLGLGLYISDQIARAHGGRLLLVQNDEHGVTFALCLPARGRSEGTRRLT